MGSWKLAAVALTRSRLEESLDYGRMTQRCRLLCRLVCPNCSFQPQLLPPTALLPLTPICFLPYTNLGQRSNVQSQLNCHTHAWQGVYTPLLSDIQEALSINPLVLTHLTCGTGTDPCNCWAHFINLTNL